MKFIFAGLVSLGFLQNAAAVTCLGRIQFIVKCNASICDEGFFAFRKFSGNWCKSLLNVKGDERTWRFDSKGLGKDANGIFSIDAPGDRFGSRDLKFQNCFSVTEQGVISLKCGPQVASVARLSYSENVSLREVLNDFHSQSVRENFINEVLNWLLPLAILVNSAVVWRRNRKPNVGKTVFLLAFFSSLGLCHLVWGRTTWAFSGLFGFLVLLAWFAENVFVRLKLRRRAHDPA